MTQSPGGGTPISIDTDALLRASSDLSAVAQDTASAARQAHGASLSSTAFGLINVPLAGPLAALAPRASELIGMTAQIAAATGAASLDAARDWAAAERDTSQTLDQTATDLDASRDLR